MKCTNCGGALGDTMTFCPYCGVRADIDLRQIHYRDLGMDATLPCPECATALDVIEFDTTPPVRIERCDTCHGTFFNPGELQFLLDAQTNPLVWFDGPQIQQIAEDFDGTDRIFYKRCPMCAELMNRTNFGGRSGVILDHCGNHGLWVEGSELRRLTEWWRAGGKLVYQQNEEEKIRQHREFNSRPGVVLPDVSTSTPRDITSIPADPVTLLGALVDFIFFTTDP